MDEFRYDYEPNLDVLHIYSSEIDEGIMGCLSIGDYTIDVGQSGRVVGVEVEQASKLLNVSPETLEHLDGVSLVVRKVSNLLIIGFTIIKGREKSTMKFSLPSVNVPLQLRN